MMKSLLQRKRVGNAFHEVLRYIADVNSQLTVFYDQKEATRTEQDKDSLGQYWMTRQDLMGYVLLGDPAVRLPVGAKQAAQQPTQPSVQLSSVPSPLPAPAQAPEPKLQANAGQGMSFSISDGAGPDHLPIPIHKLEEAIIKTLAANLYDNSLDPEAIAREYGLSNRDLARFVSRYSRAGRAALTRPQ